MSASSAGLYDDARFAGRLIVSLGQHFDHLDDVPEDLLARFMSDVSRASRTLRLVLSVDRVNVAVLGNQESHVHAHLIPRRRTDADPTTAPWQDPRPRQRLASHEHSELVALLRSVVPW
ncbi:HIT family protein [Nocardioides sp. LML1-1-1.1]|uniref:HIT family protein n=1 Tax=Nocardioides sp. LML1-1-1.1 TaxID=3135248 RepID=UPI003439D1CC